MTDNHQQQWQQSLQLIRQAVSPEQYSNYFEPLDFESYSERTHILMLKVPSQYIYEYLEKHFVSLMTHVFRSTFDESVKLKYRLIITKEKRKTVTVSGSETDSSAPADSSAPTWDTQLMAGKTFQTFIEGTANRLARSVGLHVAEHPGKSNFNPYFVFGPSGCGKTHLINAIGCRAHELYPTKRVLYVSARLFQVQYTDAVKQNNTNDFISFYQSVDMLIVDDIQEWATSPRTMDTFFHIFDHLLRIGHQIVLAADRPPVELQGVKDRLLTRFKVGMTVEVEKPNPQLCMDILKAKCQRDGLRIPHDVITYIARTANGSVRDLEGVLNSLMAFSIFYDSDLDMELAERIVSRAVRTEEKPLTVDEIANVVCELFHVTERDIQGKSRKQQIVIARQTVMYLAQRKCHLTASRIGQMVGGRDHSTVLHSCAAVEKRMQKDPDYSLQVKDLERQLESSSA
ncbi:MAG: chromosomal replication initiator protein DnaA [Prevotella sp.]|nr:chromosomal replication initiator protein DnaA [Prevotella sp.]